MQSGTAFQKFMPLASGKGLLGYDTEKRKLLPRIPDQPGNRLPDVFLAVRWARKITATPSLPN